MGTTIIQGLYTCKMASAVIEHKERCAKLLSGFVNGSGEKSDVLSRVFVCA